MTDITAFLTARLDEDEQIARAAVVQRGSRDRWQVGNIHRREDYEFVSICTPLPDVVEIAGSGFDGTGGVHGERFATHIARHDPARVLAEVAAKRAILERHDSFDFRHDPDDGPGDYSWTGRCDGCFEDYPCPTARDLAAPYAEHPDYDPAWTLPQAD